MKSNTRDTEILKYFGEHLKKLRQNKDISQEKLGNLINVPQSTIGRIERGESNPNLCLLVAIANSLEVDLKELISFEIKY
jgi:transcriptional regulator with XRE-family HTH domain